MQAVSHSGKKSAMGDKEKCLILTFIPSKTVVNQIQVVSVASDSLVTQLQLPDKDVTKLGRVGYNICRDSSSVATSFVSP